MKKTLTIILILNIIIGCQYIEIDSYFENNTYEDTITPRTIDSVFDVGEYNSLCVDNLNKIHISYYDSTNNNLKYATNKSGSWENYTLDSDTSTGEYNSISVDSLNNTHISYYDSTNYNLKYATNRNGSWIYKTLDKTEYAGHYTSIAIDNSNNAHISYCLYSNNDLKYIFLE